MQDKTIAYQGFLSTVRGWITYLFKQEDSKHK